MKNKPSVLKIYCFSNPLLQTEWISIIGDKFSSFPFELEFVKEPELGQVIVWDGVITAKNKDIIQRLLDLRTGRVFLLIGESMTLLKENPMVEMVDTKDLDHVEVPGWNVLPEEILAALEACYQKIVHV